MKKIELQQGGLEFLKSALNAGDYLAAFLTVLPLEGGAVYTFLPDWVDPAQVSLQEGGLGKVDYDDDLQSPLKELIAQFLNSSSTTVAVIEATSIERTKLSAWLANTPDNFRYFTVNRTLRNVKDPTTLHDIHQIGVYGFLMRDQAKAEYIHDFVEEGFPFQQIGVLTSFPEGELPSQGQEMQTEWLEAVAIRTQHIFAGAYDGSGMVVWSKANGVVGILPNSSHAGTNGVLVFPALAAEVGFGDNGQARHGHGVDAADFDGDGSQDLFVSNLDRETIFLAGVMEINGSVAVPKDTARSGRFFRLRATGSTVSLGNISVPALLATCIRTAGCAVPRDPWAGPEGRGQAGAQCRRYSCAGAESRLEGKHQLEIDTAT